MNDCPVCNQAEGSLFCRAEDRLQIDPGAVYRIFQCPLCEFGWTEPSLKKEELARFYPENYLGQTAQIINEYLSGSWFGTSSWRMEAEKVKLVEQFCSRGALLDVGCGEGKFLWALDPDRWNRFGVELNSFTVRLVQKTVPEIDVREGTLDSLNVEPGGLDAVTFWHVLEHLPGPESALSRACELLQPGGWVIVSLPNIASLQARWFRSHWYPFGDVPRHIYHFSPRSLEILLRRAGFSDVRFRFFSRKVNFHCWKHSTRAWCKSRFGTERPYYALKPALHLLPLLERVGRRYSIMTAAARKTSVPSRII